MCLHPHGAPLAFAAFLAFASSSGCADGRYEVEVSFMPGVDPEGVRFIELLVLPACPSPTEVLSGEAPEGVTVAGVGLSRATTALPSIGGVPSGTYGLYGRGFDRTCTAVVAGCVTVQIDDEGSEVLPLRLEPTLEVSACGPQTLCVDGECRFDPNDACPDFPCPQGAYCTDLPDPAPIDATGRSCNPLSDCIAGEYELGPASERADRVCSPCRTCAMDDLEAVACADGNEPQNRVCAAGDEVCTLVASQDGEATSFISTLILAPSGTASTMRVTDDGLFPFYGFVQFDVAGGTCEEGGTIPSDAVVQSVGLRLTRTDGCSICGKGHALERVTGGWNESNVISGLGPGVTGTVSATFDAPAQGSSVFVSGSTLVSDVQEMLASPSSNHGWRIEQAESPANPLSPFEWAARESGASSARPRLIVTYATP